MFRRLFRLITHRWFVTAVGLVAVAALIWYAGPLLGFGESRPLETPVARWSAIAIVFVVFALVKLFRFLNARRTNEEILEGIAEPEPDPVALESADEVATLQARFKEAMAVLKRARFENKRARGASGRRKHLFQLPWYVVIGPPGSGKTTILQHSGLSFPLSDRFGADSIQGIGGTRNCDWWFTDQAVLLDTAGRYTTQDSHQAVDSAAWTGFLGLLKKHRRRRPINGALVAVSLSDLLQQSEMDREAHARAIRQRIRELHENLNIRFPIYVLLTKCDLVAGFMEFFDELGRHERAQVWGTTFAAETADAPSGVVLRFRDEFAALKRRLNERLLERLQRERDAARRGDLFLFPQQFASLEPVVDLFLKQVFQSSQYEHPPLLRGVYFTSGTQEGNPINRLMDAMAGHFRLERPAATGFGMNPSGRSYFVLNLLKDVVFAESGLAGTNLKLERYRRWLQVGAYVFTVAAIAVAATAWFNSYRINKAYVDGVAQTAEISRQEIEALDPQNIDPVSALPPLNRLRGVRGGYADTVVDSTWDSPWEMGLGLYQGEKLGLESRLAYERLLVNQFLPRLLLELEHQLETELARSSTNFDRLYENLKVYLMLEDRERFDPETIRTWMALTWSERLDHQVTADDRRALEAHLDALLADWPDPIPVRLDANVIQKARLVLGQVPPARRLYARLTRDPQVRKAAPPIDLSEQVRGMTLAFRRVSSAPLNEPIPGLYTYKGYHEAFKPAVKRIGDQLGAEHWVLGEEAARLPAFTDLDAIAADVTDYYMKDFIALWDGQLRDLEVVPFANFDQAVDVLRSLSGRNSPLVSLLQIISQETTLTRPVEVPDGLTSAITNRLMRQRALRELVGSDTGKVRDAVGEAGASAADRLKTEVDLHFEALNELTGAPEGKTAPVVQVVGVLAKLYTFLHAISLEPDRGRALATGRRDGGARVLGEVQLLAGQQPAPVNRWVKALAVNIDGLANADARQALNDGWNSEGLRFCLDAIDGRYPIVRGAQREVRLEDFTRFFGPGGVMDSFFSQYLKPHVDTSRRPWRLRASGTQGLRLPASTVARFEQAHTIRQAFFSGGGNAPVVRFDLKPLTMDPAITRFSLTVDGQSLSYRHGPQRVTPMAWPGPEPGEVRAEFSPPPAAAVTSPSLTKQGDWAWFRVLDVLNVRPTSDPERFEIAFKNGERVARYEMRAGSTRNPFSLPELNEFRCPQGL